jgi:transcriptional regulator with XRE-family HTH domain
MEGMITEKEYYIILRKRKGITHNELAKHICCSQSLISRYENDKRIMSKEKVVAYKSYIENK